MPLIRVFVGGDCDGDGDRRAGGGDDSDAGGEGDDGVNAALMEAGIIIVCFGLV